MSDNEKLTPERAIRLLRAKGAELEQYVLDSVPVRPFDPMVLVADVAQFAADIALIAQLVADHIEEHPPLVVINPEVQLLNVDPHANEHIIDLQPGRWLIQHPLSERLDGSLLDCQVTWPADDTGVMYGRYVLVWDEEADEWVLGDKL